MPESLCTSQDFTNITSITGNTPVSYTNLDVYKRQHEETKIKRNGDVIMFFTVEETNLMCCFDTSSRKRLIAEMKLLPINELDDEMAELLFHTVRKLEGITDEAFAQLYIAPDSMMDD